MNKRIVITGPESSGKSTLTVLLAEKLGIPCALEFARVYLEENGPDYDYSLLLAMSRKHLAYQREHVPEQIALGIYDTDLINYKIWANVVYGKCHEEIISGINREKHHVYLLCRPDLPWEPDPLRENKDDREMLFDLHREEIERLKRPYAVIEGEGVLRLANAEKAVLGLLS